MPIYIDFNELPEPVNSLGNNKRVKVTIKKTEFNITAVDGTTLSRDFTLVFYTHADPVYATVEYIGLEGGEIIEALPEASIYLESYAESLKINDMLLFDPDERFPDQTTQNYAFFRRARTEFVKCKVIGNMIKAILSSRGLGAGRRTLADFTIDLSSQANLIAQARGMISDMGESCRYWWQAIVSCGSADFQAPSPQSAVKSGTNPYEQGAIGRGWVVGGPTMNAREEGYIRADGAKSRPRRGWSPRLRNSNF